ncbi:MAG: zf-HC2 domain-containing protein [Vicinamibacterales bacterium]
MLHLTDSDFVLHYYGELAGADEHRVTAHLSECADCRRELTRLQRVLGAIDESALAPDLPDHFERTVWAKLEPNLGRDRRSWLSWVLSPAPLALAAAVIVLIVGSFYAGRLTSRDSGSGPAAASADQVRERVLLIDLGEHLDRSQMVLVELASADAPGSLDITEERARAEQLLAANRLYRQTAATTGDAALGDLLDELERFLVEVASGPEQLSTDRLDELRKQIEAKGLLFRVRVVSSEVRERQKEAVRRRTGQRT